MSKNDGFGVRRAFRWQTKGKELCLLCFAQRVLSWSVHENFCFSFSLCLFKWGEELAMTDIGGKWVNLSKGTAYICLMTFSARCLKITEKVSFNNASKASYVFILSAQKCPKVTRVPKNVKKCPEHPKVPKMAWKCPELPNLKKFYYELFFGTPCTYTNSTYIAIVQLPSLLVECSLSMQTRSTFNAPGIRSQYCMLSQIFQAPLSSRLGSS